MPGSEPVDPIVPRPVVLREEKRILDATTRSQLPRLYLAWLTPARARPRRRRARRGGRRAAGGKNSRLYKRLVYELQIAQDVTAFQGSQAAGVDLPGDRHRAQRPRARGDPHVVDEEIGKLQAAPPSEREIERFQNQIEASFFDRLESVGGGNGKADQLNLYYFRTGDPDYFEEDLARYRALSPSDVQAAAARFLGPGRVLVSVVPEGKKELAVPEVTR